MADIFGFDELERLINNMIDSFDGKVSNKLSQIGDEVVANTQLNTPVLSGNLRRSWTHSDVEREGTGYKVEVGTNIDYAEAVEYGHKTKNGGFVKGRFMLTNVVKKKEKELPKAMKEVINELIGELKL